MNSIQLSKIGEKILKNKFVNNSGLESELILSNILNTTREKLIIYPKKNLSKFIEKKFYIDVGKRVNKKPIAYITGYKEFWRKHFFTNEYVLIGTGSGCIILSLLLERKKFRGIGIDISKNAIKVAKINAKMQQLENRIKLIDTDIDKFFLGKYDLVVSNPPYIKISKLSGLNEDVKHFEPKLALDGGIDGYSTILKVIKKSSKLLKKRGNLFLEIDNSQMLRTKEILLKNNFFTKEICKDLSGLNRCLVATKL